MMLALLTLALMQDPPVAHPATPQQVEGRRSAFLQGTLNVAAGERATLRLNDDGTYDLIDVEVIRVEDVLPPAQGSRDHPNQAAPGVLRFGLHARQDVGSILKVENGQDQGLKYSGFVVRYVRGQARGPDETSVCTAPAGMVTFEHWPEPVLQVVVGTLERSDDALPTCPPHFETGQAPEPDEATEAVSAPPPSPDRDTAPDELAREAERLGRYSTLFAVCAPYYAVDEQAGHRLADDFQRRSTDAGWTSAQRTAAYAQGRTLERAEIGVVMDSSGISRQQARRNMRQMLPRLKARCQDLAREVPGAIADVAAGDRAVEEAARAFR